MVKGQYHTQRRRGRTWAWNVRRLWRLAESLTARRIPLSSLKKRNFSGSCWFGKKPSFNDVLFHLQDVLKADLRYPIILDPSGNIMDGYHRVAKARVLGKRRVWAVQFDKLPPPDEITRRNW